jgi:hypothetical protein
MDRWHPQGHHDIPLQCCGVDPAHGGKDRFVVFPRHGFWFGPAVLKPGSETPDGASGAFFVWEYIKDKNTRCLLNVDTVAWGSACCEHLQRKGLNVFPINFGNKCLSTDKSGLLMFRNLRAFAYWSMREALDPASPNPLSLPPDPELLEELTTAKFKMAGAAVQIEEKKDIKNRIGRSPDKADALVQSILLPPPGEGGTYYLG